MKGKIAKVEGRITELCLSATVCCFLPVRSKPLFPYKRIYNKQQRTQQDRTQSTTNLGFNTNLFHFPCLKITEAEKI